MIDTLKILPSETLCSMVKSGFSQFPFDYNNTNMICTCRTSSVYYLWFVLVMFQRFHLVILGFCILRPPVNSSGTDNIEISVSSDARLSSSKIYSNITYTLTYPSLEKQKFYVPQCHSLQHNFTLAEQIAVRKTQTGSNIGDVVLGHQQSTTSLTVESEEPDAFEVYCAMTSHTLGGEIFYFQFKFV